MSVTFITPKTSHENYIENKLRTSENIGNSISNHFIGRISCAARIPIQTLGILLQTLKILVKMPLSLVATPIIMLCDAKGYEFLTFKGVYNDVIALSALAKETSQAFEWAITAPPEDDSYPSFLGSCSKAMAIVVVGDYGDLVKVDASSKSSSNKDANL